MKKILLIIIIASTLFSCNGISNSNPLLNLDQKAAKLTNKEVSGIYKGSHSFGEINGRELSNAIELTIQVNGTFVADLYENGSKAELIKGKYKILFLKDELKDEFGNITGYRNLHGINFLFPKSNGYSGNVIYSCRSEGSNFFLIPLASPPMEGVLPSGIDSNTRPVQLTKIN